MTSRKLAAPATLALFLVTVATYLVQVLAGGDIVERAIGLIPARVSNLATLTAVGSGQLVPAWLTLVTYIFPHRAWWHVTMNMAGLWFFGRLAEPIMGPKRLSPSPGHSTPRRAPGYQNQGVPLPTLPACPMTILGLSGLE